MTQTLLRLHRERFDKAFATKLLAESIGTLLLTEIVGCTIANKSAVVSGNASIGIGFALAVLVYTLGHISGAHVNPAVTTSLYIRGAVDGFTACWYILVQFIGGFIGGAVGTTISSNTIGINKAAGFSDGQAVSAEIFFTYLLCTVVINTATTKANKNLTFNGFAIGVTLIASGYAVGQISGGAFNPAVATGVIIATTTEDNKEVWVYLVGDFIGGILAGLSWYVLNFEEAAEERKNRYKNNNGNLSGGNDYTPAQYTHDMQYS